MIPNKFQISIDTGGTFTDAMIYEKNIGILSGKSLTNPENAFLSVKEATMSALQKHRITFDELIKNTEIFIYGTTRSTNAVVTKKTARTAFITTKGFKDTLILKEGGRQKAHEFSEKYPSPFIPKKLTFEIDERISAEGKVITAINEDKAYEIIKKISLLGVEAISVSLLWSFVNPVHELKIAKIISETTPELPFSLSHELIPIIREYRRASTTCIDASLKPLMQKHLKELDSNLINIGFKGQMFISTSTGGWGEIKNIIQNPIYTLKSGPSMAPIAAKEYGNLETISKNFIVCDTGGTTFDVSLIQNNNFKYSRNTWIGKEWLGNISSISSIEVESIGSGGGSIAWVDDGGLLRLGPESAGSIPGPACYDKGGEKATLSDAACVLGYLNPDYFLEGKIKLNNIKAIDSVKKIAKKINKSVEQTAFGIIELASEIMINSVRNITIKKGINPKESIIIAGGGAAGLNIIKIAKGLNVKKVIIPQFASTLSACGMQFGNIVKEENEYFLTKSNDFCHNDVNKILKRLNEKLTKFRKSLPKNFIKCNYKISFSVEARYSNQVWDIDVQFENNFKNKEIFLNELIKKFHDEHQLLYTIRDEGSQIEFLNWKCKISIFSGINLSSNDNNKNVFYKEEIKYRECFFGEKKYINTPIYHYSNIKINKNYMGPCIIEGKNTTIVLYPEMYAIMTKNKNLILEYM